LGSKAHTFSHQLTRIIPKRLKQLLVYASNEVFFLKTKKKKNVGEEEEEEVTLESFKGGFTE